MSNVEGRAENGEEGREKKGTATFSLENAFVPSCLSGHVAAPQCFPARNFILSSFLPILHAAVPLALAPVSQLLWTRKERDCVQSRRFRSISHELDPRELDRKPYQLLYSLMSRIAGSRIGFLISGTLKKSMDKLVSASCTMTITHEADIEFL